MSHPDFLIIGAAKCGTTSLYYYLRQHPQIFMPEYKEPGFLAFAHKKRPPTNVAAPYPDSWGSVIFNHTEYADLFSKADSNQITGEATPEYLYLFDDTINNIKRMYPNGFENLRFIAILRNPVERIWSHYWMFIRDGYETLPFEEAIAPDTISRRVAEGWHPAYDYVGFGLYAKQISAWRNAFGKDSLKIILLEDLHRDARATCVDLFRFLGVSDSFVPRTETVYNVSGRLRHEWIHDFVLRKQFAVKALMRRVVPERVKQAVKQAMLAWNTEKVKMPDAIAEQLRVRYAEDVRCLGEIIGRDLSAWVAPRHLSS